MATIDKIAVQISAEIGDLKREMDRARMELREFQGAALRSAEVSNRAFAMMQKELQGIGQSAQRASGIMQAAFAGVAGYGLYELAEALGEASKKMVEMADAAKRAGLAVGQMKALEDAGFKAGIDSESIQQAAKEVGKLIAEAGRGEGALKDLFEANNIKLKDRNGNLLTTVETLAKIADLVRDAGSEADKLKVLSELGLDEKLVRVLEKGGSAIRQMAEEGSQLTPELQKHVEAAAQFESAWRGAWVAFKSAAASEIAETQKFLTELILGAERLIARVVAAKNSAAQAVADLTNVAKAEDAFEARRVERMKTQRTIAERQGKTEEVQKIDAELKAAPGPRQVLTGGDRFIGQRDMPDRTPAAITPGKGTKFKDKDKGGGGSNKDETSAEEKQIERFILTLEKEARALKAEAENFFRSNLEKQTAINLAKAGDKATDEQRKKIEEATKAIVEQQEELRKLKMAKEGLNEAFAFGGSMLLDFTNGLIEGQKAGDLFKNSLKRITSALLEMAILGQGPLAKLFGTSGVDGAPGGLIGALLGGFKGGAFSFGGGGGGVINAVGDVGGMARMAGGGVGQAGQWAMVGENGPELIRFGRSGRVFPTSQTRGMLGGSGGGGATVYVSVAANGDATIKALVASGVAQGLRQYDRGILGRISERQARA